MKWLKISAIPHQTIIEIKQYIDSLEFYIKKSKLLAQKYNINLDYLNQVNQYLLAIKKDPQLNLQQFDLSTKIQEIQSSMASILKEAQKFEEEINKDKQLASNQNLKLLSVYLSGFMTALSTLNTAKSENFIKTAYFHSWNPLEWFTKDPSIQRNARQKMAVFFSNIVFQIKVNFDKASSLDQNDPKVKSMMQSFASLLRAVNVVSTQFMKETGYYVDGIKTPQQEAQETMNALAPNLQEEVKKTVNKVREEAKTDPATATSKAMADLATKGIPYNLSGSLVPQMLGLSSQPQQEPVTDENVNVLYGKIRNFYVSKQNLPTHNDAMRKFYSEKIKNFDDAFGALRASFENPYESPALQSTPATETQPAEQPSL